MSAVMVVPFVPVSMVALWLCVPVLVAVLVAQPPVWVRDRRRVVALLIAVGLLGGMKALDIICACSAICQTDLWILYPQCW